MVLANLKALFSALDRDGDGLISPGEVGPGAAELGWGWPQAPLLALLHRLALAHPLDLELLETCLEQAARDPLGPYGTVLHRAPPPRPSPAGSDGRALLIIDPQRAFTEGCWMRSVGPGGHDDVAPIRAAFRACADVLGHGPEGLEVMVTRCPFPPDSYGWEANMAGALPPHQPYFLKPGNSVLFPPSNGFRQWVEALLEQGRHTLVLAGCTLNSCVRVSALEVQARFGPAGLQVIVDPTLCGARQGNHQPSDQFDGRSSVQAALDEMAQAGILIQPEVFKSSAGQ